MSGPGMNTWPDMYLQPDATQPPGAVQQQVPYSGAVPLLYRPSAPVGHPIGEGALGGSFDVEAVNNSSQSSGKRSTAERMDDLRARNKVAQARYRQRKRQAAQAAHAEHARLAAELESLRSENAALSLMVDARERMLSTCDESLKLLRAAADAEAAQSPALDLGSLRLRSSSGAHGSASGPAFGSSRSAAEHRYLEEHGRAAWHLVERCYASEGLRGAPGVSQGALDRARGALVQAWSGGVQGTPWAARPGGDKEAVDRLKTVLIGVREAGLAHDAGKRPDASTHDRAASSGALAAGGLGLAGGGGFPAGEPSAGGAFPAPGSAAVPNGASPAPGSVPAPAAFQGRPAVGGGVALNGCAAGRREALHPGVVGSREPSPLPGAFPPSLEDPMSALEALGGALDDSWLTQGVDESVAPGHRDWRTVLNDREATGTAATPPPPQSLPPALTKLLRDLSLRRDVMRTYEEDPRLMPGQIAVVSTCQGMLAAMVESMEADGWGVWTDENDQDGAPDQEAAKARAQPPPPPPQHRRPPPVRLLIQWLDAGLIDAPDPIVSRAWFEHASRVREALKYLRKRAEDAEERERILDATADAAGRGRLGQGQGPGTSAAAAAAAAAAARSAGRAPRRLSPPSRRMRFDSDESPSDDRLLDRPYGKARWKELGSVDEISSAGESGHTDAAGGRPTSDPSERAAPSAPEAASTGDAEAERGDESVRGGAAGPSEETPSFSAKMQEAVGSSAQCLSAATQPPSTDAPPEGCRASDALADAPHGASAAAPPSLCLEEGVRLSELGDDVILAAEVGDRIDSASSLPISLTLPFSMDDAAGRDPSFSMPEPSAISQTLLATLRTPSGPAPIGADDLAGIDAPGISPGEILPSGIDAPGIDAPSVDAPGIDAPGIDAPGLPAARLPAPSAPAAGPAPVLAHPLATVSASAGPDPCAPSASSQAAGCVGRRAEARLGGAARSSASSPEDPASTPPRSPRVSSVLPPLRACTPPGILEPSSPLRPPTPPGAAIADPSVTPAIVHVLSETPELLRTPSSALKAREEFNCWIENQFRDICTLLHTLACYRTSLAIGLHNGGVAPTEPPSEAREQWHRMAKAMRIERWQAAHLRRVLGSLVRRQAALRAERARLVAALLVLKSDQISLRTSASDALAWRAVLDALDSCKRRELSDLGAFHVNGFAPFRPDQILEPMLLSWPHLFDCIHMAQALLEEATLLYGDNY